MSFVSMMLSCAVALASVAASVIPAVYCDVSTARLVSWLVLSARPLTAPLSSVISSLLSFAPPKRPEKKFTTAPTPSASQPMTVPRVSPITFSTFPITSRTGEMASRIGAMRPRSSAMGGRMASAMLWMTGISGSMREMMTFRISVMGGMSVSTSNCNIDASGGKTTCARLPNVSMSGSAAWKTVPSTSVRTGRRTEPSSRITGSACERPSESISTRPMSIGSMVGQLSMMTP